MCEEIHDFYIDTKDYLAKITEVVELFVFLASDESSNLAGLQIVIDGDINKIKAQDIVMINSHDINRKVNNSYERRMFNL